MDITTSPDISTLSVQVTWDVSNALPQIVLLNQSTGGNLAGCVWAFVATSPSQTPIHSGNVDNPDVTGNWTNHTLNDAWPRPYNQIEWSGAPYSFYVIVKDTTGAVYTAPVQYTNICRPVGNTQAAKNTYGLATSDVKVQCQQANIYFQDTTYHVYQGQNGTQISSVLRVIYPIDETLVIPDPFVAAAYSTALVPISYSSKNYQFVQTQVYDYPVGDNSLVRVRYQTIQSFGVFCNVDLLPLVCEINKLLDMVESGSCMDAPEAQRKMNLVVGKFALVMIGIEQPLTGVDVPLLIEQIIEIGGFDDCNCCTVATGIIPTTSSVIGGYNFLFNKLGGTVNGSWTTNGNNITLNLSDVAYVVAIGNQSPYDFGLSVSSTTSSDGYLKTYYINIDGVMFATNILNVIKNNVGLVNLFNSIVNQNPGDFELVVNMDCIGTFTDGCLYTFTFPDIPASPLNAILTQIQSSVDGNQRFPNQAFNLSSLPALQTYLNGLGIGTFTVTHVNGTIVTITTTSNTFALTGMVYSVNGGNKKFAQFASDCSGFVSKSANQVVQAIIDYLCGITDAEMVTSQDYVICEINPESNLKVETTVPAGTKENLFLAQLLDGICNTVDYILAQNGLNCPSIKSLFISQPLLLMQNTDILLGTKAGECAGMSAVEVGTRMLQLGVYNVDYMAAFCTAIQICAGGNMCAPYTTFSVLAVDTSPSTNQMNILITFVHPNAISNNIRWARIDNTTTPVYTVPVNKLPGQSPYLTPNLDDGQYSIGITPVYADGRLCGEVFLTTVACSGITAFSAVINGSGNIVVTWTSDTALAKVEVVINYPNGGKASTDYTGSLGTATITPPSGVYGDYFITLIPVCNLATGFKGVPTAPVILPITPPNNSIFTNNTSNTLAPISMIVYSILLGEYITVFNVPTVAGSGGVINFYLADGNYDHALITYPTGTVGNAYLIASSGNLIGTVTSGQVAFSPVFTAVGGIKILVIDPSPAP